MFKTLPPIAEQRILHAPSEDARDDEDSVWTIQADDESPSILLSQLSPKETFDPFLLLFFSSISKSNALIEERHSRVVADPTGNVHAPAQAPARRRGRPAINAAPLATPSELPISRPRGCSRKSLISEAIRVALQVAAPNKAPESITVDGRCPLIQRDYNTRSLLRVQTSFLSTDARVLRVTSFRKLVGHHLFLTLSTTTLTPTPSPTQYHIQITPTSSCIGQRRQHRRLRSGI